jgi:hypothetical protein
MGRMTGWGSGGGCSMLVVAAMALLAGCGSGGGITDDPTLATLTHDDVAGIPPGTAIGTAFGGVYASVTESIVRCHCRQGSCAMFRPGRDQLTVIQADGSLTMTPSGLGGPPQLLGGVDQDGAFSAGGFLESTGDVEYVLFHGLFQLVGGKASSFHASYEKTVSTYSSGVPFDCDFVIDAAFNVTAP